MSTEPYYPIVYVRGYASLQSEINSTVDDPFYGFNTGSTHVRVGAVGDPDQFFFESPVVRLMTDYGYRDTFSGRTQSLNIAEIERLAGTKIDPWRTIWIFRYYDVTADTYGKEPKRLLVEEAAAELAELIERVRQETGAKLVHLVAHSMGGLVCRSLLEKIYPDQKVNATQRVARFYTYATPHGGIQFRNGLGWLEKVRDMIGAYDSDTFGPKRMYEFLTPKAKKQAKVPKDFDPRIMKGFPLDNVFCAVGTNSKDYDVAAGSSSFAVGAQSDGLVQIDSAYVLNGPDGDPRTEYAHRAYVHRCHSGRYGIVNSEEAFQNLERFLFGTIQAMVALNGFKKLPPTTKKSYQLELTVSVRGLPVPMHERTRSHFCPIVLNDPASSGMAETYPLFTQFLNGERATATGGVCRFAVSLSLYVFDVKDGKIDYSTKLHGIADWTDQLLIDVVLPGAGGDSDKPKVLFEWSTEGVEPTQAAALSKAKPTPSYNGLGWVGRIGLPAGKAQELLGEDSVLEISAYPWVIG